MFCDRRFRRCLIEMAPGDTTVGSGPDQDACTYEYPLVGSTPTDAGPPNSESNELTLRDPTGSPFSVRTNAPPAVDRNTSWL